ncbi:hypothetical protein NDI37_02915 [Funiculus sociatus GB2-A5]|uniref:Uncharacterized protein n=1 Tax=Funiculus sociatus GB2-A5 TaxID=2933946 RepID=A0ABV0JJ27_9CYAN|nr:MULTISPECIES: hypothetical protein [unclassified Trichocoleus]MBD1907333.1 hypothetical protein [Trichocoleus sp. FACHB-832]
MNYRLSTTDTTGVISAGANQYICKLSPGMSLKLDGILELLEGLGVNQA